MNTATLLEEGLLQLKLDVSLEQRQLLLEYVQLLHQWNRTYNLTAIHDLNAMVMYHLLDSLSIGSYLLLDNAHEGAERFADVGTGAGLPGIPLAIAYPEKTFVLLECRNKKVTFLRHVCHKLKLPNVDVVENRVENYIPEIKFDVVLTRAFASLREMFLKTKHLCKEQGRFFAMKGRYPTEELEEVALETVLLAAYPLKIPGVDAERHLMILRAKD